MITGAAGSIGSALAREYAAPGMTLILHARKADQLAETAAWCLEQGATVMTYGLDLRDIAGLRDWLGEIARHHAIDMVIANAGVNTNIGPDGAGEDWAATETLLDVNIKATLATVDCLLPAMRQRGSGQIVLISSLAAYFGLPVTPSYCASKAALKAYGEALRGWLAPAGILVNVVMPGYVASPMCHAMPGPKPFLLTADRAARKIRRGLARNRPRIAFPIPLSWGCWWLSVLHPSVSQRILRWLDYGA